MAGIVSAGQSEWPCAAAARRPGCWDIGCSPLSSMARDTNLIMAAVVVAVAVVVRCWVACARSPEGVTLLPPSGSS